ncbi:MAG: hypothetical protein KC502_07990 [Myxococcales bacterium]|nr:hypothetical protein [Myxococcales bacterium]
MKIMHFIAASALVAGALTVTGCSGSKKAAKATPAPTPAAAPAYPSCATDAHCASHAQVCVAGTCKQCREHAQCSSMGPCGRCEANACVKVAGCCATDADCGGGRCRGGKCR